jgi:hypothetical protein
LTITNQILDKDNNPKTLEKVVWQTDYDMATGRLFLYRSHSGLIWEDNLLDKEQKGDWSPDRQLFVPLCTGLSYFKVQIPKQQDLTQKADVLTGQQTSETIQNRLDQQTDEQKYDDAWNKPQVPVAVTVTLSFAAPVDTGVGGVEVPDDQKIVRTIVIDRSKKMTFNYVAPPDANTVKAEDANSQSDSDPNKARRTQPAAQGSRNTE